MIESVFEWLGLILALAGGLVAMVSGIGMVRLPDIYTRAHAAGVVDTLAAALVLVGVAFVFAEPLAAFKLMLILALLLMTTPVASHALVHAAFVDGEMTMAERRDQDEPAPPPPPVPEAP